MEIYTDETEGNILHGSRQTVLLIVAECRRGIVFMKISENLEKSAATLIYMMLLEWSVDYIKTQKPAALQMSEVRPCA